MDRDKYLHNVHTLADCGQINSFTILNRSIIIVIRGQGIRSLNCYPLTHLLRSKIFNFY